MLTNFLGRINSSLQLQGEIFTTDKGNFFTYVGCINGVSPKYLGDMLDFYGTDYLKTVTGSFSLVFHNVDANEVTLVRDHFGNSNMYYLLSNDCLIFSSSLVVLHSCSDFEIDESYVDKVHTEEVYYHNLLSDTIYKDIKKLYPGQCIKFRISDLRIISDGHLHDYTLETNFSLTDNDAKQAILSAIIRNASGSERTAVLLSGGLDSNVMLSVSKQVNTNLFALTSMYHSPGEDYQCGYAIDPLLAEECARYTGVEHVYSLYKNDITFDVKKELITKLGIPCSTFEYLYPRYISLIDAKKNGAKVIIKGDNADDLLTGQLDDYKDADPNRWISKEEFADKVLEELPWFPVEVLGDDYINNDRFVRVMTRTLSHFVFQTYAEMHGIEIRNPFNDQHLVKTMLTIPGHLKFRRVPHVPLGIDKFYVRELLKEYIPPIAYNKTFKVGWMFPKGAYSTDQYKDFAEMCEIVRNM